MFALSLLMFPVEEFQGKGRSFSHQLQQKVVTSAVFSGKKEGYLESLSQPFLDTRLSEFSKPLEASATCSWLRKALLDQTDSFPREIPSWQGQNHLPLEFLPLSHRVM